MLKRFINWIAGVGDGPVVDPNEFYPDICDDLSLAEIERRLRTDDEDDTANFDMEMDEDV